MKPSSDWLDRLKLIVQECQAETGVDFDLFVGTLMGGYIKSKKFEGGTIPNFDYHLAKAIDRLKGSAKK